MASAIATVRRAISACSSSTILPSTVMAPLPAFSGSSKAEMILRANSISSADGEKALLQGAIWTAKHLFTPARSHHAMKHFRQVLTRSTGLEKSSQPLSSLKTLARVRLLSTEKWSNCYTQKWHAAQSLSPMPSPDPSINRKDLHRPEPPQGQFHRVV